MEDINAWPNHANTAPAQEPQDLKVMSGNFY